MKYRICPVAGRCPMEFGKLGSIGLFRPTCLTWWYSLGTAVIVFVSICISTACKCQYSCKHCGHDLEFFHFKILLSFWYMPIISHRRCFVQYLFPKSHYREKRLHYLQLFIQDMYTVCRLIILYDHAVGSSIKNLLCRVIICYIGYNIPL